MMHAEDDFDSFLASALAEPAVVDESFTSTVVKRLKQHRRRRSLALGTGMALSGGIAGLNLYGAPEPAFTALTPPMVMAGLLLAGFCSVVWISTEIETWG